MRGAPHVLGRSEPEADQSPFGLVGDGVTVQLGHDGIAEFVGSGNRRIGIGGRDLGQEGHAEGGEQRLGRFLGQGDR